MLVKMCERLVNFDRHGDIRVQLQSASGPDSAVYIVCSRALARVSPVLRSEMRHTGPAKQAQTLHDSIIQLEGNDHDSLTIFLNIAHANFLEIPRRLSISQLYNLTILTSHYHCTKMLAPWVDSWISTVRTAVRRCDIAMMLWVSWELRAKDDLGTMARRMAGELDAAEFCAGHRLWSSERTEGVIGMSSHFRLCLDRSSNFGGWWLASNRIPEYVSQIRLKSLQALLQVIRDMLEELRVSEQSLTWSRFVMQLDPSRCRQATGALVKYSLGESGLWPLPGATGVQESVAEVYTKLAAVISHNHNGCEFGAFWCGRLQRALDSELGQAKTLHTLGVT